MTDDPWCWDKMAHAALAEKNGARKRPSRDFEMQRDFWLDKERDLEIPR